MGSPLESPSSYLIVGLGNPGPQYAQTRHNIGFEVVDCLARRWGVTSFAKKFQGKWAEVSRPEGRVYLLKPETYMNRSGISVGEAAKFYKIESAQIIVVSDDLDLPPGMLRLRPSGGPGGHNGLKSLIEAVGELYPRLRIGIGRHPFQPAEDYVLSKISSTEQKAIFDEAIQKSAEAVESILKQGVEKTMNTFNQKPKKEGITNEP